MGATWKTKWGMRRVRQDTPTIEEALIAAESLADDPAQRAQIAAQLMGVPVEEVQVLAAKQAARTRGRASLVAGRTRAVVVEYKRPRTIRPDDQPDPQALTLQRPTASQARAGVGNARAWRPAEAAVSQIGEARRRRPRGAVLAARGDVGRDDRDRDQGQRGHVVEVDVGERERDDRREARRP